MGCPLGGQLGIERDDGAVTSRPEDAALMAFFRAIASRELHEVARILDSSESSAVAPIRVAASRHDPEHYFLDAIKHYVYAGDTALHVAAAAYQGATARALLAKGADARARNRRGAEPLHYAADGIPGSAFWDPDAQREIIEILVSAGADPDACDKSGVAALHRAVRTRCSGAVAALLQHGANPRLPNKRGSTPLHLAVQNTGRGESGAPAAEDERREIITMLFRHGARPTDTDASGKTVEAAATSDWIRELLS
jgi:hypothetical protein